METWDPQFVDELARHFRVIIFDNAGVGRSAARRPLTVSAMADQTSALITALHLGSPDVLGWSMGSMIAQALAIRHPGQVHRLVLCATYPGTGNTLRPNQKDIDALTGTNPRPAKLICSRRPNYCRCCILWQRRRLPLVRAHHEVDSREPGERRPRMVGRPGPSESRGAPDRRSDVGRRRCERSHRRLSERPCGGVANSWRTTGALSRRGHAFLFQEGAAFTFLVRSFLLGAPKPVSVKALRKDYVAA